jgi:hypothetical protein
MRHWTAVTMALALAGGTAAAGIASGGQDDLAIVKKAVASPSPARARAARPAVVAQAAPAAPAPVPEARPLARSGREPQWFKVRVVERATGRRKVTVNLPISIVRAFGDETIDWGCRTREGEREKCHTVRLSDVLRSLEAGQELVEIEDDDATVKVWVE